MREEPEGMTSCTVAGIRARLEELQLELEHHDFEPDSESFCNLKYSATDSRMIGAVTPGAGDGTVSVTVTASKSVRVGCPMTANRSEINRTQLPALSTQRRTAAGDRGGGRG